MRALARIVGSIVLAPFAALGCFGGSTEPKPSGSALWLASDSGELVAEDQARFAGLGLKEVFLDAGDLVWDEALSIRRRELPTVPKRTPSTLAVHGLWLPGEREPLDLAKVLLAELLALRIEAEQSDILVIGYHFTVEPGERGEHFAKTLAALHRKLDGKAFLSLSFDRRQLDGPDAKLIASAVDFVVCFLYGQYPGEAEDPTAWDLQAVEGNFRKLEALGRPYLTGAITLGTAYLHDRTGKPRSRTTLLSLGELVNGRQLELKPGFTLEGIDRQVFEFVAQGPTTIGEWRLDRGESIRIVRTATPLMEEFRRRVGAWESPMRLGEVYYRLPRAGERLSLSAENLATVLGPENSRPELDLSIARAMDSGERWIVSVRLENRGGESSDLAFFDNNFVELAVDGATVLDVEAGDFRRVDLFHDGERGTMQALRAANQVRYYLPLLEGRQVAESGPTELVLKLPEPVLRISASFLLPDGHLLTTDPIEWSFEEP